MYIGARPIAELTDLPLEVSIEPHFLPVLRPAGVWCSLALGVKAALVEGGGRGALLAAPKPAPAALPNESA